MKDWNSSMNIQLVKKNNVDQDMLSYEKNLRQHKLKTAGMVVAVIAIIVSVWNQNQSGSSFIYHLRSGPQF